MAVAEQIYGFELSGSMEELEDYVRGIEALPPHLQRIFYAELFESDLYALLRYCCGRKDLVEVKDEEIGAVTPRTYEQALWLFDRCREVQADPNGYLDLWSREFYKSTIHTFAGLIFRIINDQNISIGIFSHTKPIARDFLGQIKLELETNPLYHYLWPEIFYAEPNHRTKGSPRWNNDAIVVKRTDIQKEATIEAHGIVDGQPTSKHFDHLHYDDVVTLESVNTPEMIQKTTSSFEMSSNLGSQGGSRAIVGTIYHFGDTYMQLIKKDSVKVRKYPCTKDGTDDLSDENCLLQAPAYIRQKRKDQGPYTFGTQMLLNPKGDGAQSFDPDWIKKLSKAISPDKTDGMWKCILVDPAHAKRKHNDWTSMWVVGIGADSKYVALDVVRDRMNLSERWKALRELHQTWLPDFVGYEKYGKDADIESFNSEMERSNYRFDITPLGGTTAKPDRIKWLIPEFENGRIYLRPTKWYTNHEGETLDLIEHFIEQEYKAFPVMSFDDMFDCLARIMDPNVQKAIKWPAKLRKARPKVNTQASNARGPHPSTVRQTGVLSRVKVVTGR